MRITRYRGKDTELGLWRCGRLNLVYDGNRVKDYEILNESVHRVDGNTVSQSLEMNDKYGKEIYEGDILKNDNGVIGFIRWNCAIAGFSMIYLNIKKMTPVIPELTKSNSTSWVVISNIYDNPSLKLF